MAQGFIKKPKPSASTSSSASAPSSKRASALGPKRGQRSIKPKKTALLKVHKMNKKFSGGLTVATEMSLAKKAGHLEMLPGGKKDKGKGKDGNNATKSKKG